MAEPVIALQSPEESVYMQRTSSTKYQKSVRKQQISFLLDESEERSLWRRQISYCSQVPVDDIGHPFAYLPSAASEAFPSASKEERRRCSILLIRNQSDSLSASIGCGLFGWYDDNSVSSLAFERACSMIAGRAVNSIVT
jgi:hypothetical protein